MMQEKNLKYGFSIIKAIIDKGDKLGNKKSGICKVGSSGKGIS